MEDLEFRVLISNLQRKSTHPSYLNIHNTCDYIGLAGNCCGDCEVCPAIDPDPDGLEFYDMKFVLAFLYSSYARWCEENFTDWRHGAYMVYTLDDMKRILNCGDKYLHCIEFAEDYKDTAAYAYMVQCSHIGLIPPIVNGEFYVGDVELSYIREPIEYPEEFDIELEEPASYNRHSKAVIVECQGMSSFHEPVRSTDWGSMAGDSIVHSLASSEGGVFVLFDGNDSIQAEELEDTVRALGAVSTEEVENYAEGFDYDVESYRDILAELGEWAADAIDNAHGYSPPTIVMSREEAAEFDRLFPMYAEQLDYRNTGDEDETN